MLCDIDYRLLFETAPDPLIVVDNRGTVVALNCAASEVLGGNTEAIVGEPLVQWLGSEQSGLWQALARGESLCGVEWLERVKTWVEYVIETSLLPQHQWIRLRILTDSKVEVRGCHRQIELAVQTAAQLGISIDQSDRYHDLQQASQKNQLVIESIQEGVWEWDPFTDQVKASDRFCEILGLSNSGDQKSIAQSEIIERIFEEDQKKILSTLYNHLYTGEAADIEIRIRHQEGHYIWVRARGKSVWVVDPFFRVDYLIGTIENISHRKVLEEELHAASDNLERILAGALASISQFSLFGDGSVIYNYYSPKCELIYGYSAGELIEDPELWRSRVHPEDWQQVLIPAIQRVMAGEKQCFAEFRFQHRDGRSLWIGEFVTAEADPDNNCWKIITISTDITIRKNVEIQYQKQSAREQTLRRLTQVIRQSLDLDQTLTTALTEIRLCLNADRAIIFRFSVGGCGDVIAESVRSDGIEIIRLQDQQICFADYLMSSYQLGESNCIDDIETAKLEPDYYQALKSLDIKSKLTVPVFQDQALWGLLCIQHCQCSHSWQEDEQDLIQQMAEQVGIAVNQAGLYHQVQGLALELDKRLEGREFEIEQALRFESVLRLIIERVRDSLDEDQILETAVTELGIALQTVCTDTGIYNSDITESTITHEYSTLNSSAKGKHFRIAEGYHPEIYPYILNGISVQFCDLLTDSLRGELTTKATLVTVIRDQQTIFGDLWLVKPNSDFFTREEVRLVEQVAIQCAIALRQSRLYQATLLQVQRLQELNQLKEDFIHTVSHELRTPLTSMKVALKMIEIYRDNPNKQDTYIKIIQDQWKRELDLVNELLELQSLESGSRAPNLSVIEINSWIKSILEPFYLRCQEREQHFHLEISSDSLMITSDHALLSRVVLELLNNACKYTPSNHSITLKVGKISGGIKFQVINTGATIPQDSLMHIFEKFHRIQQLDIYNQGGTGLGLALASKAVELLQGSIDVVSENEKTTFTVKVLSFQ